MGIQPANFAKLAELASGLKPSYDFCFFIRRD